MGAYRVANHRRPKGVVMRFARAGDRLAFAAIFALSFVPATSRATGQQSGTPEKDVQASLVKVPAEVPANATRYTILIAGTKAGVLAVWNTSDGARHTFFAFNDRGRGPSVTSRIVLDRAGCPTQLDATGNDYLKKPVDEHFRIVKGKASWSSKAEK